MEEKRIFGALQQRGARYQRIDVRGVVFSANGVGTQPFDVILIRCLSQTRALHAARLLAHQGIRTVNRHPAFETCGDKVLTSLALQEHGVPTPRTAVAFSSDEALKVIERMGYPAVLKPPVGSWGRLMAKVNDREAAEALLEHKGALAGDAPFYVQQYVPKPGRDIRTMVVGDQTVYAVYRYSEHWITNTARGGETSVCPLTPAIDELSRAAARAVGGEIVAVDLLELPRAGTGSCGRLLVSEVNHTPEFHGASEAIDVDVPGCIADYVLAAARG